jgi:CBS domain containing-hemolysin-like protein
MEIFITLLLVFANGFFVAAEFAIVKVRLSQVELEAESGNKTAMLSKHILKNLNGYLAATQLGITLASLGLGWVGEPVVSKIILKLFNLFGLEMNPALAHDIALPIAFAVITILHIVFGELAPKSIAIQNSQRTTFFIAYPLRLFYIVFKPFIWILNGIANSILKLFGIYALDGLEVHSNDELKYLVKQGKDVGTIEEADYDIIKNAFDFSDRIVKQVMVHRTNIVGIDVNAFDDAELEKVIEEGYSRIICYENSLDNVIGVVYLKDLLLKLRKNETINIRELLRPILAVPESRKISSLMKEFQLKHQQVAVIISEHGGTTGIVTMEDILEELVGEIQDEFDNEIPIVEKTSEKNYTVISSASIHDINEHLPHPITESENYETLAGIILAAFGKFPNTNDKIVFDDYEFTILKKIKHSIILVQLRDLKETSLS